MSDERFQLDIGDDYCFINDKIEDRTYAIYNDRFKERWSQEIVDLLNEQDKKIKELKKRINELESKYANRGIAIIKAVEDLCKKEEVYLADFDICKRITEYEWEFNNE